MWSFGRPHIFRLELKTKQIQNPYSSKKIFILDSHPQKKYKLEFHGHLIDSNEFRTF